MDKPTSFEWGWNGHKPWPDPTMTRVRMATLMRAWRRATIQGEKIVEFKLIVRVPGRREYFVRSRQWPQETNIVVINT